MGKKKIIRAKDINNFSYKNGKKNRKYKKIFSYKVLFEKNFFSLFYFTYFCMDFFNIKMNRILLVYYYANYVKINLNKFTMI